MRRRTAAVLALPAEATGFVVRGDRRDTNSPHRSSCGSRSCQIPRSATRVLRSRRTSAALDPLGVWSAAASPRCNHPDLHHLVPHALDRAVDRHPRSEPASGDPASRQRSGGGGDGRRRQTAEIADLGPEFNTMSHALRVREVAALRREGAPRRSPLRSIGRRRDRHRRRRTDYDDSTGW